MKKNYDVNRKVRESFISDTGKRRRKRKESIRENLRVSSRVESPGREGPIQASFGYQGEDGRVTGSWGMSLKGSTLALDNYLV